MKTGIFTLLLVLILACGCAFAQGTTGTSTTTITTDYIFPPVGLASGLTAAVSLTNIAPVSTSATATQPSCTGTVTFTNAKGATIGTATSFTVASGAIDTVSLPFNSSVSANGGRVEIVASVQQTTTRPSGPPCSLIFSLEVYDSNGETHVFMGNASASTPPQTMPSIR